MDKFIDFTVRLAFLAIGYAIYLIVRISHDTGFKYRWESESGELMHKSIFAVLAIATVVCLVLSNISIWLIK